MPLLWAPLLSAVRLAYMTKKSSIMNLWIERAQKYWWVIGVVVGFILVWGNLPNQMARAEKKIEKVDAEVDDLKGWAKEVTGYTRAMQQMQQQQMQQQSMNQPAPTRPASTLEWWQDHQGTWWYCDHAVSDCANGYGWVEEPR